MALQSSGPISLANIAAEFGGSAPHSLSEFYRGGGKVPNASQNNNVPTSGAISLGNFYGAVNRVAINITISSNQTNYVLNTAKASGYVAGVSDITLTINSGVYVSANSTGAIGLDVDTSWASGDTVTIVNNGFIVGMGGAGGNGHVIHPTAGTAYGGTAGAAGGGALRAQRAVSVNNAGTIAGGGGGGGGGYGSANTNNNYGTLTSSGGGGGGGGGRSSAAANSSGGSGGGWASNNNLGVLAGAPGGAGTLSGPGGGGLNGFNVGSGGGGGDWGSAGGGSTAVPNRTTFGSFLPGGSGGAAVSGNGNISWVATGTRLGAIT